MNRNRLLAIGLLAICLALVVSFTLYRFLRYAVTANRPVSTTPIVVAAGDLSVGDKLEEKDLRLIQAPQADLPAGVFHSLPEVVGRGVVVPIARNEPVLAGKLAAEKAGAGLPSIIPAGMRAVSVRVNDVVAVAGFVVPGTRVDVLLTGQPAKQGDVATVTVLENVQVLAAGQKLQKNAQGEPQQVTVITLMVNPEDAQKLTLASSEGKIQLALRNPLDTKQEALPLVRTAALYRAQPIAEVSRPQTAKRVAKAAPPAAAAPSMYVVEMIRGDKRDVEKF